MSVNELLPGVSAMYSEETLGAIGRAVGDALRLCAAVELDTPEVVGRKLIERLLTHGLVIVADSFGPSRGAART